MGRGLNKLNEDDYVNAIEEEIIQAEMTEDLRILEAENLNKIYYDHGKQASASDLIDLYNEIKTVEEKTAVYEMIRGFNPEMKMSEFENKIYQMYEEVFLEFINRECPTHICDTGLTSQYYPVFHNFMMTSTIMGKHLTMLVDIIST